MSNHAKRPLLTKVIEGWVMGTFWLILVIQAVNILFRYTRLCHPAMWPEEMTRYVFIWITFLVWHLLDRENSHFSSGILTNERARKHLELPTSAVALLFGALVIRSALAYIPVAMMASTESFRWLPMGVVHLVVPVGMLLVLMEHVRSVAVCLRSSMKTQGELPRPK